MTYSQGFFLALIQGLTEFLPISSSGHLVIFQKIFGLEPPVIFDILVHIGTLGAVLVYFKKELLLIAKGVFQGNKNSLSFLTMIAIGTIPALIFGLILQNQLAKIFDSLKIVALSLLLTALILFLTKKMANLKLSFNQLKWQDSFLIGCFQALAILPGVSRSGSTIAAGLWRGLKRKSAFRFSFFLAIPACIGALILQIPDLISGQFNHLGQSLLGMIVAAVTGFWALKILERVLLKAKFWVFGAYCLLLSLILFLAAG